MITIDWLSLGIGAASVTLIVYLYWLIKPKKKKMDIGNLQKLVYETGIHITKAYKGIKELEKFFKEVKAAK